MKRILKEINAIREYGFDMDTKATIALVLSIIAFVIAVLVACFT